MLISQPQNPIGEQLKREFYSGAWTQVWIATAWVRESGVNQLQPSIAHFLSHGGMLRITSGVDLGHTSREGLQAVVDLSHFGNSVGFVYCNEAATVFHPKVYLFANDTVARIYVGSSNLTASGLYTNTESVLCSDFPTHDENFTSALQMFANWTDTSSGLCRQLDAQLVAALEAHGYIEPEAQLRVRIAARRQANRFGAKLFGTQPVTAPSMQNQPPVFAGGQAGYGNGYGNYGGAQVTAPGVAANNPLLPGDFWIQTGQLTGGSGNQLDLSMISLHGQINGSRSFFVATSTLGSSSTQITIRYQGIDYEGNSIIYPTTPNGKSNGTWRLQLKGTSAAGARLTASCPEFKDKILTFRELSQVHYEITNVLDSNKLAAVQQSSAAWDVNRGPGGRAFGRF